MHMSSLIRTMMMMTKNGEPIEIMTDAPNSQAKATEKWRQKEFSHTRTRLSYNQSFNVLTNFFIKWIGYVLRRNLI